jgi:hypothetical protein
MPEEPTKPQPVRVEQGTGATKSEAGVATTKDPKAKKGQTNFLLRLPPDLRSALESFKDQSGSKSLQNLILQLLAEGLASKADFRVSELFARDLHVASLAATAGSAPEIIGNRRVELVENTANNFVVDQAALLEAHQRVILELENQKLTSFASIMDPALLSYRLLIDYASQDLMSRDPSGVVRDFSNGLALSARQAMIRGKWSFAELLLLQAAAFDPSNIEVSNEAGIYLLRRLVRRWCRPSDSLTPGVSNRILIYSDYERQPSEMREEDVVNETAWSTAKRAWDLLVHDDRPELAGPWYRRWTQNQTFMQELTRGSWRVEVWKRLATIIVCTSSPDRDDLKLLGGSSSPNLLESVLVREVFELFGEWEKGFRMTREVSRLQWEWSEWFEPLEVLWWLGYRAEAHALAAEARGFVAVNSVMDRMTLIRNWKVENEHLAEFPEGYYQVDNFEVHPIEGTPVAVERPTALFNRPMSI